MGRARRGRTRRRDRSHRHIAGRDHEGGRLATADYLSGRRRTRCPRSAASRAAGLLLTGANENNLHNVTLEVPFGTLTVVTGVSGSGKSSLVTDTLAPALANRVNHAHRRTGAYKKITGLDKIDKVINIDQSPIGRTPRSNPATYIGLWDDIRALFASTSRRPAATRRVASRST